MSAQSQAEQRRLFRRSRRGRAPAVIGVLGAGTMGAGIAQLACARGRAHAAVRPDRRGARAGRARRSRTACGKEAAKGRLSDERGAARRRARLQPVAELERARAVRAGDRGGAGAPGAQARALRAARRRSSASDCVLATNTSSLPVTAIAAGGEPPRARRGHALLQPGAGDGAAGGGRRRAVRRAGAGDRATRPGEAMGKTVIRASDGPGFLVNRCNRPFGLEALRLLQERHRRRRDDRPHRAAWRAAFAWGPSS